MSENETSQTPESYGRARVVAGLTLAIGALASLAFNIKAISLDHAKALAKGLTPDDSAYVAGLLAPLFLAMAIELLQHTPWRTSTGSWAKNPDTWVRAGVLVLVAGVAAWISYWHGVHVLGSWGYDEVAKRVGPVVPDAAMILATLALHRVGQAKRGHVATQVATRPLATRPGVAAAPGLTPVATARPAWVATAGHRPLLPIVPATDSVPAEIPLEADWADLEADLDREVAEMINAAKNAPEAPSNAPASPAPTTEGQGVKLTTVPAAAAALITEALAAGQADRALDARLVEEGLASSDRTARRYRAAVANGTARVS